MWILRASERHAFIYAFRLELYSENTCIKHPACKRALIWRRACMCKDHGNIKQLSRINVSI